MVQEVFSLYKQMEEWKNPIFSCIICKGKSDGSSQLYEQKGKYRI